MTGGVVAIFGRVGDNFAAGITGGMTFVYDADGLFEEHVNPDSVVWQRVETDHWRNVLFNPVEEHRAETRSALAAQMLAQWERESPFSRSRFRALIAPSCPTRSAQVVFQRRSQPRAGVLGSHLNPLRQPP